MDSLRSCVAPLQEYLLQGSILDTHCDLLLHRLSGLCDNIDTGPENFHDQDLVYTLRAMPAVPPVILRVRHAIDLPDDPWHIRYIGQSDIGNKSRNTLIRSCLDIGTSVNIGKFLSEMGFVLEYEYIVKGYMFQKGRLKITVSKILKVHSSGNPDIVDTFTGSHLVELSIVTAHCHEQIQDDIKNFADQLKPLVHLEKIDHKRLL